MKTWSLLYVWFGLVIDFRATITQRERELSRVGETWYDFVEEIEYAGHYETMGGFCQGGFEGGRSLDHRAGELPFLPALGAALPPGGGEDIESPG